MSYESFTLLTTISFISFIIGWLLKIKIDTATCLEYLMSEPDAPSSQHSYLEGVVMLLRDPW